MKKIVLLPVIFLFSLALLKAQNTIPAEKDSVEEIFGTYQFAAEKCIIRKHNETLFLEIAGQGKTSLTPITANRFRVDHVNPETIIEIVKDSLGTVRHFRWLQDVGVLKWIRVADEASPHPGVEERTGESIYEGRYRLKKRGLELRIKKEEGKLIARVSGEGPLLDLVIVSRTRISYTSGELNLLMDFKKEKKGKFQEIHQTRTGAIEFVKIVDEDSSASFRTYTPNRQNGFRRADSLRGMLTPLRTCYDVLFYKLDVTINPVKKSVSGSTIIRFKALEAFVKMQVDLYANMKIEHVRYKSMETPYKRESNAVFIEFPDTIQEGTVGELEIVYAGQPRVADFTTLTGGFIWYHDKNGKPWVESVCQGAGASLWWPCKDHLSDKPDSMQISVTVPTGLTEISNGKLRSKTDLADNLTRFDWYVSYPITNYNVVVNLGDYTHFTDQFIDQYDTLAINYYSLSYNKPKALAVFKNVKPMLALYKNNFGKYPFENDGFTAMESLYPMEHQGAISIGPINNPVHSDKFDLKELTRTMWHEAAHEWWGNSITCSDMADLWIHEAFATYTETLNYEAFSNRKTALKHLGGEPPQNKEPIIGVYQVNDFHLGDMYSKGALMLHTMRSILDNDSLFFNTLKGLQSHFRYQSVTSEMIVAFINENTNHDFTPFFDQYLKYANIPELELKFTNKGHDWVVQYRWNAEAKGFNMPVKITGPSNQWVFIYPTASWQQMILKRIKPTAFKVDTENFYIKVKRE